MAERKIRSIAKKHGYSIQKTYRRYLNNNAFVLDQDGEKIVGYVVMDLSLGSYVWGCYNEVFSGLWSWEEVEQFVLDLDKGQKNEK